MHPHPLTRRAAAQFLTDQGYPFAAGKRPGLTCMAWPVRGYNRCRMHLGLGGGSETAQRASVANMHANRALWIDRLKAEGLPYPCRRKSGGDFWTPATIAYYLRRYPQSLCWRRKAAQAGKLPASLAVLNPNVADALALWSLPNREAIKYLPTRSYQRKRSGLPNANRGDAWLTPKRIADLERRFPRPDAKWRKKLAPPHWALVD
jgi:hypothetical protein